jgi:hypothetical protein
VYSIAFPTAEAGFIGGKAERLPEVVGREIVGAEESDSAEACCDCVFVDLVHQSCCVCESPSVEVGAELVDPQVVWVASWPFAGLSIEQDAV